MKEQILNEIAEKVMVKLAKHEVELALVDDLNNLSQKIISLDNLHKKEIEDYNKLLNNIKQSISKNSKLSIDFLGKIKDAEMQAKGLGLDIKFLDKYKKTLNDYYETTKKIDSIFK